MVRKTRKQVFDEFYDMDKYKWEFLRRNEEYIEDCEKWSGRERKEWSKEEIIICYRFRGNLKRFANSKGGQYSKNLLKYYYDNVTEWSTLALEKDKYVIKRKRIKPNQPQNKYSWFKYAKKWDISLPLNPFCAFLPFFIDISPFKIIEQPRQLYLEKGMNDIFLEEGTKSFIKVNWANSEKYIMSIFKEILSEKQKSLKEQGIVRDRRTQFAMFDTYLQILDWKKEGYTLVEIAQKCYPSKTENNLDTARNSVKENYRVAKKLRDGGYKNIGKIG